MNYKDYGVQLASCTQNPFMPPSEAKHIAAQLVNITYPLVHSNVNSD